MRINLFGLVFESPCVTFSLGSNWRASALAQQLIQAVGNVPGVERNQEAGEKFVNITNPRHWDQAMQALTGVLKGWQEEAEPAGESRNWRWFLEGDIDADGFDQNEETASLWGSLRLYVDASEPGEEDEEEEIDLEGFYMRIWGTRAE